MVLIHRPPACPTSVAPSVELVAFLRVRFYAQEGGFMPPSASSVAAAALAPYAMRVEVVRHRR